MSSGSLLSTPGQGRWRYRSRTAGSGCSVCPRSPTGLPRRWWPCISEERAEPRFHPDSYGYRPNKSALDAVGTCRERCWRYDWVIDLDVAEVLRHRAVGPRRQRRWRRSPTTPWVLLYVKRWLASPAAAPRRHPCERDKGTPQGSAVSPMLANLFMHFAFDCLDGPELPGLSVRALRRRCCRALCEQAAGRSGACRDRRTDGRGGPDGCTRTRRRSSTAKDGKRRGDHEHTCFTFLGFTFRAREATQRQGTGAYFSSLPAGDESTEALKAKSAELRAHAHPSAHRPDPGRPGPMAQPHRGRVDEVLRPVLPVGDGPPPPADQLLPEALGREEVPATANPQSVHGGGGQDCSIDSPACSPNGSGFDVY